MEFVQAARGWIGTPWRHQCKIKGRGVDCQMLLDAAAVEAGMSLPPRPVDYSKIPSSSLEMWLNTNLVKCRQEPGCIALMNLGTDVPYHLGIITDKGLLHAWNGGPKKVVEHAISSEWQRRIVQCYRLGEL